MQHCICIFMSHIFYIKLKTLFSLIIQIWQVVSFLNTLSPFWSQTSLIPSHSQLFDTLPLCRASKQSDVRIKGDNKNQPSFFISSTRKLSIIRKNLRASTLVGLNWANPILDPPSCTTLWLPTIFNDWYAISIKWGHQYWFTLVTQSKSKT